ncbi:MAG: HD domain-containing protein [candidate division FCPU426 bacterium]
MLTKDLLLRLFDAAYMLRWNDKVRPVDLVELDKQAHKMVIAYILGKLQEKDAGFDWIEIIEGGIFELLQRMVVTDIKPPIFHRIRADAAKYRLLNQWVFGVLENTLKPLGPEFCSRFQAYFAQPEENINRRILNAAHFFATKWEFDIIQKANPTSYDIEDIAADLHSKQERYQDLVGIQALKHEAGKPEKDKLLTRFINLCGELRFQIRWANLHRIPKTSVMGHMLFVGILAYLFSLQVKASPRRRSNNFFTGLFHDLPEVLTRDIISPVKKSVAGLSDLIKEYEKELMHKEVYSLLPPEWHAEMRLFTEHEFSNLVEDQGRTRESISCDDINEHYNHDRFNPRDGHLVRAADELAAFLEADVAISNGSSSHELSDARKRIKYDYQSVKKMIGGIDFGQLYFEFD